MIDFLRQNFEAHPSLTIASCVLTAVLLAIEYYILRTNRRTRGLAERIEAEVGPWLNKIRDKHFGKDVEQNSDVKAGQKDDTVRAP